MVAAWLVLMMRLRRLSPFRRKGCSSGSRRRGGAFSRRSDVGCSAWCALWLSSVVQSTEGHDDGGIRAGRLLRQKLLFGAMASHVGALGEAAERRRLAFARPAAHGQRATKAQRSDWLGRAASPRASARRTASMPSSQPGLSSGIEDGQQVGIGMLRRLHDRAAGATLHHLAGIEDHHLVADRAHRREIVADEHQRQAKLAAQLRQQLRGSRRRQRCRATT